jgi:hypothetical protein
MQDEKKKNILETFFEQLSPEEQILIRDYLQNKNLESLSRSFDSLTESSHNEN